MNINCPLPKHDYPNVLMAHGGGGRMMHRLIEDLVLPAFSDGSSLAAHDGAVISVGNQRLAFTTDSFVVKPLFFPGGDIGSLAVHGTVNDLAMCGAQPLALSCGLILEEGLPMETLERIVQSMKKAAQECGVRIVTGDTKVVDRGKADGLYINTAGIGLVQSAQPIQPEAVKPGDIVILNGDLGRHGMAIMAQREGLSFETTIESDSAPLWEPVRALLAAGIDIHCLRDLTRGGLASALGEIAEAAHIDITIEEGSVPVHSQVRGGCEILGLDPLYVANEGRFVGFVPECDAVKAVDILKMSSEHGHPAIIGRVEAPIEGVGRVKLRTPLGPLRLLDMLSGEQLPRIC